MISIWDATYVYLQKSTSYTLQKKSYSSHKYRNLAKFMMLVATDGYIIDTVGPYVSGGGNNDAKITEDIFRSKINGIEEWFESNDNFIVDRGFRDCQKMFEDNNFKLAMPNFLSKGKSQHTTVEANQSRLVTKIR